MKALAWAIFTASMAGVEIAAVFKYGSDHYPGYQIVGCLFLLGLICLIVASLT